MSKEERTKTLINNIKLNINEQNVYEFGLCVEQWKQILDYIVELQQENKQLKDNWNKLKKELKDKFKEYRYVEDECLRTMAQEDDSILFSMSCIEKGDSNE